MTPLDELWLVVSSIPHGRAASYGEVGRALKYPASGYLVGRWMAQCPSDVPWWRVVSKNGSISLSKRSPEHGQEQVRLLTHENVEFDEGRVSTSCMIDGMALLDLRHHTLTT